MSKSHTKNHGSLLSYFIGFIFSIVFTLGAYFAVTKEVSSVGIIAFLLVILALAQVYIQLRFFLHINNEEKPKWNKMAFLFMALVVVILVLGSLWIMDNLHYNMMPDQVDQYIIEDEGFSN